MGWGRNHLTNPSYALSRRLLEEKEDRYPQALDGCTSDQNNQTLADSCRDMVVEVAQIN
jgi:hypothetical protein